MIRKMGGIVRCKVKPIFFEKKGQDDNCAHQEKIHCVEIIKNDNYQKTKACDSFALPQLVSL